MDVAVAEPRETAFRLSRDTIVIVEEHNPAGAPRDEADDLGLEPAVRDVDREQRVTGTVLPLLAHIEEGDLAAIGEPSSHRRDVDGCGHRHALLLDRLHYAPSAGRKTSGAETRAGP